MRTKKTMRLMSWNVNASKIKRIKNNKSNLDNRIEAIANVKADIVTLQQVSNEVATYFKEKLSEIDLDHIETSCDLAVDLDIQTGPHKNGTVTDGVLIASRWPLELIPEFFEQIPWQKSALSVIVETPYGEIEVHTVHVPNASSSGQWKEEKGGWIYEKKGTSTTKQHGRQIKVDTFNGIYKALSEQSRRHRILCGDFNSPKEEYSNGRILTFDEKNEKCDPIKGKDCERKVLCGLAEYDLKDSYTKLHDHNPCEYSWVHRRQGKETRRRLDHIFSSGALNPKECRYLHDFRESGLSDHSPVYAGYEPEAP